MKVLYVHPAESGNVGDQVILAGCRNIMRAVIGEHEEVLCNLECGRDYIVETLKDVTCDIIVVSGTPWLWDMWEMSVKFQTLKACVELYPHAMKIGLGLGSCYPLDTGCLTHYFYDELKKPSVEAVQEIFSQFNYVTVRDEVAWHCFQYAGVPAHLQLCPSAFIEPFSQWESSRPLLIFHDCKQGISGSGIDKWFADLFIEYQLRFMNLYNPLVLTATQVDNEWCMANKITSHLVDNLDFLLYFLGRAKFILSGRVHAAIPARLMGKRTWLLPCDTRYLTAVPFGVKIVLPSSGDLEMFEHDTSFSTLPPFINIERNSIIEKVKGVMS
jgi:hypothetical protein